MVRRYKFIGLVGGDKWESARCDMIADLLMDFMTQLEPVYEHIYRGHFEQLVVRFFLNCDVVNGKYDKSLAEDSKVREKELSRQSMMNDG